MGVVLRTSLLVPARILPVDAQYQVFCQAKALAIDMAQKDQAIYQYDYTVRALDGLDFVLARADFNETVTATAGTNVATYEVSGINAGANNAARRDRVIVVYGLLIPSSVDSVTSIRWVIGGQRTHQWFLGPVFADDPSRFGPADRTLYVAPDPNGWIDPVQIPTGASVLLEHYVRTGTAVGIQPSEIIYLGVVVEPIGGGGAGLSTGG